jgi:hypothetical protein
MLTFEVLPLSSTPPIRLHGVVLELQKHRDNFTFYLYLLTDQLTNSMEQSPSRQANSHSAIQKIACLL